MQWEADNSPLSFTDWERTQPNNSGGFEDCSQLYDKFNFRWADTGCAHKTGFICQRPMVGVIHETKTMFYKVKLFTCSKYVTIYS